MDDETEGIVQSRLLPVELHALVGRMPVGDLEAAAARAARIGVTAEQVLLATGRIDAESYAMAVADWLGLAFDDLARDPATPGALDGLPAPGAAALRAGFVAIDHDARGLIVAVAARGDLVAGLVPMLRRNPAAARRLRITSPSRLRAFVLRRGGGPLAEDAAFGLKRDLPAMSAALPGGRHGWAIAGALALLAVAVIEPGATMAAMHVLLSVGFLAWIVLRLLALFEHVRRGGRTNPVADADLPVYTILVPLYREAPVVPALVAALRTLDYPPEKLDLKLIIESDDAATRAAIDALGLPAPFDIIVAPLLGPRTKPKALCAAMLFARGAFVVVYDAEDRPDPDQLKIALGAFRRGGPRLGCVQARLAIDNARDNWLTRHFASEYAGLFDVLLPMLVALKLPIPLGGTSNHFRLTALESSGAWDPYNVTEDADLGMRLARFGWRTDMIASTTWEEAPRTLRSWMHQRTRWFKGWMQTWLVHMRDPRGFLSDVGPGGFLAFQLMVGGTVLSALVHPLFLAVMAAQIGGLMPSFRLDGLGVMLAGLSAATLVSGYVGSAALALVGLSRRNLLSTGWVLLTIPVYWLLLSAGAWRGLWQLLRDPFRWEKTDHGFARTSITGGAAGG